MPSKRKQAIEYECPILIDDGPDRGVRMVLTCDMINKAKWDSEQPTYCNHADKGMMHVVMICSRLPKQCVPKPISHKHLRGGHCTRPETVTGMAI